MGIIREMINRLLKVPLNKSCFIFGPRQVGKSTFLKDFFKRESFAYYDLLKTYLHTGLSSCCMIYYGNGLSK
ncbi:MAG: hypothetical protein A3I68_02820 [Candidatus Melainabacteria bacterium RIFCSPLOWO2_02_FULL_35_15]|nr:MAG: hypothetical protein A3F80_02415 [Candidatus Melainabacteria bacterium RIFCSPLOWO2_12_FULL_35_11]OGI13062.1 MAG: hypothetical protein A3I68_02820 [Candidatus Melainabacteria bacterium RIFCSPLOWO2_02_FULL_35_15]